MPGSAHDHCTVRGYTDLVLGDHKFSGNAQRRRHRCLVFHGTFLLDYDPALMERVLRVPSQMPDYRHRRGHGDFLTCLPLSADAVKDALRNAWSAQEALSAYPEDLVRTLVAQQYASDAWNWKLA